MFEALGKTASAWALYVEVAEAAKNAKRPDREQQARAHADALQPKLRKMVVAVSPAAAAFSGLDVRRDGVVIDKATWGMGLPVDPGEHTVRATAPEKKPWEGSIKTGEPGTTVEITIPALEDLPPAPVVSAQPAADAPTARRSVVPAIVLGSAAVVAAGVGGALFGVSKGKESDATDFSMKITGGCTKTDGTDPNPRCNDLVSRANNADMFHNIAVGSFIGAGVLSAAAIIYLLLPAAKKTSAISVMAAPGQGGLVVWGSF
jgi:hypothetical protein